MALDTFSQVVASSTSRQPFKSAIVSVNNAPRAVASRCAPHSSGTGVSRYLLMPTKIALIAIRAVHSIRARSCSIRSQACRCRNILASRRSDSSPIPNSNLATATGPSFRYPSTFSSLAKRRCKISSDACTTPPCFPLSSLRKCVATVSRSSDACSMQ
jgi:hypothetical protein